METSNCAAPSLGKRGRKETYDPLGRPPHRFMGDLALSAVFLIRMWPPMDVPGAQRADSVV